MIYAVLNQKGGVGKTTLSIHIAAGLHKRGLRVLLVDADPQGSALSWSAASDSAGFPVIGLAKPTLHKDVAAMAEDYDRVIIDCAPRANELARSAILAADMVLIPVQPSPYDVWAASETVELIKEAQIYKESLKAAFVINRKIVNTAIGRDVREALEGYALPVLKSDIAQRVIFAESAATGSTALDLEPAGQAAKEINNLISELEK